MTAMNILKFLRPQFVQTEVKPPEQRVGKLKLSEAIRRGCKIHPQQHRGSHFEFSGQTCVMGAAAYGAGFDRELHGSISFFLDDYFGKEGWGHALGEKTGIWIHNLNQDGISRERIADLLERKGY